MTNLIGALFGFNKYEKYIIKLLLENNSDIERYYSCTKEIIDNFLVYDLNLGQGIYVRKISEIYKKFFGLRKKLRIYNMISFFKASTKYKIK